MHAEAFLSAQTFGLQRCSVNAAIESHSLEAKPFGKRDTGNVQEGLSSVDSLTNCFRAKLSLDSEEASLSASSVVGVVSPSSLTTSTTKTIATAASPGSASESDAALLAELERLLSLLGPLLMEVLKTRFEQTQLAPCAASASSSLIEETTPLLHPPLQRLIEGVRSIRLLLSAAGTIPVSACREAKALPLLVASLSVPSKALMVGRASRFEDLKVLPLARLRKRLAPDVCWCVRLRQTFLQFEAAWCLTNIASGSSSDAAELVEMGCLVSLYGCLFEFRAEDLGRSCGVTGSGSRRNNPVREEEVLEQVLWALANLSGDNATYRNLLLEPYLLLGHAARLLESKSLPSILHELLNRRLQQLSKLAINRRGTEERREGPSREGDACSLRTSEKGGASAFSTQSSTLPRLSEILSSLHPHLWMTQTWRTSSWLLSNLCRGSPKPKLEIVKDLLPLLDKALGQQLQRHVRGHSASEDAVFSEDPEVVADACWAVDGVACQPGGVQHLLNHLHLLHKVIHVLSHSCGVCCCAKDAFRRGPEANLSASSLFSSSSSAYSSSSSSSSSSARLNYGKKTNPCCRFCRPRRSESGSSSKSSRDNGQLPLRPALRILGQVAAGTPRQTQALLDCCCCVVCQDGDSSEKGCCDRDKTPPVLRVLQVLLVQNRFGLCKDACWCISNLAVGSRSQLRQLAESGVLQEALRLLQCPPSDDVRREALWVAVNSCITASSYEELLLLLTHGVSDHLWTMLEQQCAMGDEKGVESAMEAIANVLTLAEKAQEEQRQRRSQLEQHALNQHLSQSSLGGHSKNKVVSCGCCRDVSLSESLASCRCPCHEPLLLLSKITPQSKALLLLKQIQQHQFSPILDQKSQVLANAILRLMEQAPPSQPLISFT